MKQNYNDFSVIYISTAIKTAVIHQSLKQTKHSGRAKTRWVFEPACVMQFADNVKRDKLLKQTLRKEGWRVVEIWECELKGKRSEKRLAGLILKLK